MSKGWEVGFFFVVLLCFHLEIAESSPEWREQEEHLSQQSQQEEPEFQELQDLLNDEPEVQILRQSICPANEELDSCGNRCEGTCELPEGAVRPCPLICDPPACACKSGFYRRRDGICVPYKEC